MSEKNRSTGPVPAGRLLIIGGAENKGEDKPAKKNKPSDFEVEQIIKKMIELSGKRQPHIEIITSASTESKEGFKEYKKAFTELGINNIAEIHHESREEVQADESLLQRIKDADIIFFAGGDQLKYSHFYGGTEFITLLKERYIYEPIVVAGTSAGAMVLSTPMIYAGNDEVQELGGRIKVTTGLEFLKDVCIDTHFVHRGRFVRLAQIVATNPGCIGIGIEEDTAISISNGVEVDVVGTGTIIVIEGYNMTGANIEEFTDDVPISMRNLNVHILSDNDRYEIRQFNPPHV